LVSNTTLLVLLFLLLLLLSTFLTCSVLLYRKWVYIKSRLQHLSSETSRITSVLQDNATALRLLERQRDLLETSTFKDNPLSCFRLRSQFGEDLVLLDFFGTNRTGFYVEAGGYDGLQFSATAIFESLGWKGLLVEPHPSLFEVCRKNRPQSIVVQKALGPPGKTGTVAFTCVDYDSSGSPLSFRSDFADAEHTQRCYAEQGKLREIQVPVATLDELLEPLTAKVDLVVIDTEGHEIEILRGFNLKRFAPKLLLVEIHWNEKDKQMREFLQSFNYLSAGIIGCNEFFCNPEDHTKLATLIERFHIP
jgi:FkbM family methyltransferase